MTSRHIWIPLHFTEAQADVLLDALEGSQASAKKMVEAFPAPAPKAKAKSGPKSAVSKDTLTAWMHAQGFEWNVHLKQDKMKQRREMILEALKKQKAEDGPLQRLYHRKNNDPYVLNSDRKEIRDRLMDLAQELWGDPLVIDGETPEQALKYILRGI